MTTHTGLLVRTNGTYEEVAWEGTDSYPAIKKAMNGATIDYQEVSISGFPDHVVGMFLDDEGKLIDQPVVNPVASAMWTATYGVTAGYIAGDVLFVSAETSDEGDTLGLTANQIAGIKQVADEHFRLMPRLYVPSADGKEWQEVS